MSKRALTLALLVVLGCFSMQAQDEAPSPSPTAPRKVRISFLPPPLEGTVSVGIYDLAGRLVRVLHRETKIDDFTAGDDALITFWDGRSDSGEDVPAGKYHARGLVVADEIRSQLLGRFLEATTASPSPDASPVTESPSPAPVAQPAESPPFTVEDGKPVLAADEGKPAPPEKILVKLVANPLENDARITIELNAGFSSEGTWLQTIDGLPLRAIASQTVVTRIVLWKPGERTLDVFQQEAAAVVQYRLSNLDRMMRFDCGAFDLK